MSSFRIRPRFKKISSKSPKEIENAIRDRLRSTEEYCVGRVIPGHAVVKIPPSEIHYWSPQLTLTLEQHEEGTLIHGLYGPSPNVWTKFMLGYLAISVLSLFISIIGFSALSLGQPAPILWVLPVLLGIGVFLYILSQMGQKLGAEQLFTLHHFLEDILKERIHVT